jgi:alkyl sulfatase BDS1-like metallo-beta-lactamase superfamily hydrolase
VQRCVVAVEDAASGKVPIIAPRTIASFEKFAIGEYVVAGHAISRRAQYAFGSLLDLDPKGMIACGIGIASTNNASVSCVSPTDSIAEPGPGATSPGRRSSFSTPRYRTPGRRRFTHPAVLDQCVINVPQQQHLLVTGSHAIPPPSLSRPRHTRPDRAAGRRKP